MFTDVKSLLPKSIDRSGLGPQVKMNRIMELFEKIADRLVSADLRESVRAVYYNNRILTVATLSSYAQQEIERQEELIIKEINENLEERLVRKISYLA